MGCRRSTAIFVPRDCLCIAFIRIAQAASRLGPCDCGPKAGTSFSPSLLGTILRQMVRVSRSWEQLKVA